ncbi:hypothetical protein QKT49_gp059 [Acanthamoeba castellanii medusavirus]|uniref:Uncharacterized protein n=1 Tax=Acanthamoeba castellanii medusavirus J1 TaxID=3114988 RepID=A0A3T1CWL3_9VIRU|nr:hypothetical protein QKT49_gp059 [Acanthamoeba castellanii medusavirus]BBI30199.1 hypothetical protein [Acanthamoeba castellanii medusavirus J1]
MDSFPDYFTPDAVHDPPDDELNALCWEQADALRSTTPSTPVAAADIRARIMIDTMEQEGAAHVEVSIDADSADVEAIMHELRSYEWCVSERIGISSDASRRREAPSVRVISVEKYEGAHTEALMKHKGGPNVAAAGFASIGLMSVGSFGTRH